MRERYLRKKEEIQNYQREYRLKHQSEITKKRRPYQREVYLMKRVVRRLAFILEAGGQCVDCGNNNLAVLQFHHRDASQKEFELGRALNAGARLKYSYEIMKKELLKCDLLCGNCHAMRHNSWTSDELEKMIQLAERYFAEETIEVK